MRATSRGSCPDGGTARTTRWCLSFLPETSDPRAVVSVRRIDCIPDPKFKHPVDKCDNSVSVIPTTLHVHGWVPRKEAPAFHEVTSFLFEKKGVAAVTAHEVVEAG